MNGTGRQFLFFLFLGISQPILAWNGAITVLFNLLNFFAIFLEFSLSRQVGTKRENNFNLLSLSLFQPILAWNHAIMVFFIFLNFYATFLEFSITHRVGTERNGNTISIFALSRPVPTFLGLKRSHNGVFLFFELSLMPRVGTKRNDCFYFLFFSAFSNLFWHEMKL